MLSDTARNRLNTLLIFLRDDVRPNLNAVKFDLNVFGHHDKQLSKFNPEEHSWEQTLEILHSCGFAGCACGWAWLCPELPWERSECETPSEIEWEHVQEVFDIDQTMAYYLFGPFSYRFPWGFNIPIEAVIQRISEVLNGNIKEI